LLAPRLEELSIKPVATVETMLTIGTPGLLETLREEPFEVSEPGPDELQVGCLAHGLNFRDVLMAMNTYAGSSDAGPIQFGGEFAGVVLRAGEDSAFAPGMSVVGFAADSLRSAVNADARFVWPKPAGMTFAEAATIPVVFLTAQFGLSQLARLEPGQTVLVHSAAGGLGQAAIQLARRRGAKVLVTAGSEEKRAFLKAQGVEHVYDSRSTAFADEVLQATRGVGVDVVLNSLSGDKIAAGLRALRRGGTFLEVGKRDIWSHEQVAESRSDVRYCVYDLGEEALRDPALISEMGQRIFAAFAAGELKLLPYEVYSILEAETAFRYMAAGKHIGKLVLTRPQRAMAKTEWLNTIREGTVLITGGTGALGMATARWLLERGARSLVLVSRSGNQERLSELQAEFPQINQEDGPVVLVGRANIAEREQLEEVLHHVRRLPVPIRVVMHAAGEVKDRLVAAHTAESFVDAMRTKVEGARLLAEMTAKDGLAETIYFSSMAATMGSAGQASYAAANAYLDGLAAERSAHGLRTLSVNWGAWTNGGMVDQLSEAAAARIARRGMRPMAAPDALNALRQARLSGRSNVAIADVDWVAYEDQFPAGSAGRTFASSFLPPRVLQEEAEVAHPAESASVDPLVEIRNAPRSERLPRMEALVRSSARKVLGLSAGRPMPGETPLQDLGLDSLMALELRNVLAQAVGRSLSATLLFDYPTIRGLAQHLYSMMLPVVDDVPAAQGQGVEHANGNGHAMDAAGSLALDQDFASMSDAEAEELLLAELNRKGVS
jgi:NADPH:quinone reductase-like Zn-dependent oxidoreductase/acyl carrier protein